MWAARKERISQGATSVHTNKKSSLLSSFLNQIQTFERILEILPLLGGFLSARFKLLRLSSNAVFTPYQARPCSFLSSASNKWLNTVIWDRRVSAGSRRGSQRTVGAARARRAPASRIRTRTAPHRQGFYESFWWFSTSFRKIDVFHCFEKDIQFDKVLRQLNYFWYKKLQ